MTEATIRTNPLDDDHLREECGVFGIRGSGQVAPHAVLGLHALQHRGQEATGVLDGVGTAPDASGTAAPAPDASGTESAGPSGDSGYKDADRKDLDKVFQSQGTQ